MTDIPNKLDILDRNVDILEMTLFERDIENNPLSLTKELYVLSKIRTANKAVEDALGYLGLGSVEEIDKYRKLFNPG